ncbi:MAG: ABC transporter ATP-binding protein [Spirochaetes bacterium]|nr:ABC transporter ATP-binding protein [Spirochaetota bacterium]
MNALETSDTPPVTSTGTAELLRIEDLHVSFRTDSGNVPALRGVTLAVREHETVGIVGESGSGKSALGLSLLRLHNPRHTEYRGAIRLNGRDILSFNETELNGVRGKEMGIIFQEPMSALNPVMRVGDQIIEALLLHTDMPKQTAYAFAEERLAAVGIPDAPARMRSYPHELSGGMRQRVMITLATVLNPSLLVADEPTTALDVTVQRQVMELMKRIKQEFRIATIFISHDLGLISDIADRIAVMYLGEVVEHGDKQDVIEAAKHPYTSALLRLSRGLSSGDRSELKPITGSVPSPRNIPSGCAFHPRCERVFDRCRTEHPELCEVDGRKVRCHLYT